MVVLNPVGLSLLLLQTLYVVLPLQANVGGKAVVR